MNAILRVVLFPGTQSPTEIKSWNVLNPRSLHFFPLHMELSTCCCAHSCSALWGPLDCSPPGSFVHEISQARILEYVAISFSMVSFQHRDRTCVYWGSSTVGRFFTHWATWEAQLRTCFHSVLRNSVPHFGTAHCQDLFAQRLKIGFGLIVVESGITNCSNCKSLRIAASKPKAPLWCFLDTTSGYMPFSLLRAWSIWHP